MCMSKTTTEEPTMSTNDLTERHISDMTGFDTGEWFADEREVRAYFTPENMRQMFTGFGQDGQNPALALTEAELDAMADAVIENRRHMDPRSAVEREFVGALEDLGATASEIDALADTDLTDCIDAACLAHERLASLRRVPSI